MAGSFRFFWKGLNIKRIDVNIHEAADITQILIYLLFVVPGLMI